MTTSPSGEVMSSRIADAVNYHAWILSLIRPNLQSPALEVGFGYGQYTRLLAGLVDRLVAIDIDPAFLDAAGRLPAHVDLRTADITDPTLPEQLGRAAFGSLICLNVLEHIEDDEATLGYFREMLRPGGRLMLLVPAHQALYGPMDELAGHQRRYNRRLLCRRLTGSGFLIREARYFNPLGGVGWWVNARFAKPKTLSDPLINRQILLYDRFVQPLSRLLDPLTARFFGQSLWALAVRDEGHRGATS